MVKKNSKVNKKTKSNPYSFKMTFRQEKFVDYLLASPTFDLKDAASKAGYKHPSVAANQLMKKPQVVEAIEQAKLKRQKRTNLDADAIWTYLAELLDYNPIDLFTFDTNGSLVIDDLRTIPREIAKFIDSIKAKRKVDRLGNIYETYEITMVSKATALALAARHGLVTKHQVDVQHSIDWDSLYKKGNEVDAIERRINFEPVLNREKSKKRYAKESVPDLIYTTAELIDGDDD